MPQRGVSLWALIRGVWRESKEDDLLGTAAQLSFYFLLSLFPLLIFVSALAGQVFAVNMDGGSYFLKHLTEAMPESAREFVRETFQEITGRATGRKLSLSLLATLWVASSGMASLIKGLNTAYDVKDLRRWLPRRLVALMLTVVLSSASLAGLVLALFGRRIGLWIGEYFGFGTAFNAWWFAVRFLFVPAFVFAAVIVIYRYGPDKVRWNWKAHVPGALTAIVVWVAATSLFRLYLHWFGSYSKTYGSLGAVIVLMIWFYVTGMAVLVGGEVNYQVQKGRRGSVRVETNQQSL